MVMKVRREWHKFWFLTYNTFLAKAAEADQFEKYIKKSKYHGDKLIQLLRITSR